MTIPKFDPDKAADVADRISIFLQDYINYDLTRDRDGQMLMTGKLARILGVCPVQTFPYGGNAADAFKAGSYLPLWNSLEPLFKSPSSDLVEWMSHRLAGNRNTVRHTPVTLNPTFDAAQWNALEVVDTQPSRSRGKTRRMGVEMTFRVVDGPATPIKFSRWMPSRFLFVLARDIGFNQRHRHLVYSRPECIYRMRMAAELNRGKFDWQKVDFNRYDGDQFIENNRVILRERNKPCPDRLRNLCCDCLIGEDQCPARGVVRACRPVTLTKRTCSECGTVRLFERNTCVTCRAEGRGGLRHGQQKRSEAASEPGKP